MFIDDSLAALATGRSASFFSVDMAAHGDELRELNEGKSILVVGGAGSIGAALVREIWEFAPRRIDVVDINENGLSTLARYIRGSRDIAPSIQFEFNPLDFGDWPMQRHLRDAGPFDVVYNFAAVKHVRSEKNLPCILHMLNTNVLKQYDFLVALRKAQEAFRYFVVSTDKAADPSNVMGASKRLLEYLCFGAVRDAGGVKISSARFANVAFSNGSLLESFVDRLASGVPLAAPRDTRRYFISPREAAQICLLGELKCPTGTIAIPRLDPEEHLVDLCELAGRFLRAHGREPAFVDNSDAAFEILDQRSAGGRYPVVVTPRDTAGEKEFEVFTGANETVEEIGLNEIMSIRAPQPSVREAHDVAQRLRDVICGRRPDVTVDDIHELIQESLPNFQHITGHARLDDRL
jgi:FlaA1/EpsC-like NDP-sugar epimerase